MTTRFASPLLNTVQAHLDRIGAHPLLAGDSARVYLWGSSRWWLGPTDHAIRVLASLADGAGEEALWAAFPEAHP